MYPVFRCCFLCVLSVFFNFCFVQSVWLLASLLEMSFFGLKFFKFKGLVLQGSLRRHRTERETEEENELDTKTGTT